MRARVAQPDGGILRTACSSESDRPCRSMRLGVQEIIGRRALVIMLALSLPYFLLQQLSSGMPQQIIEYVPIAAQSPPRGQQPPTQSASKLLILQRYSHLQTFVATHQTMLNSMTSPPLAHACIEEPEAELVAGSIPPLRVVYFISFMPNRFWATKLIVEHQLVELALVGLADHAELHLVVQTPSPDNITWLKELVVRINLPSVHYHFLQNNLWEFPGIHVLWELACREDKPHALYLYMHSKGVSRIIEGGGRSHAELIAYYEVVYPWRAIVRLFLERNRNIETAGFIGSPEGWLWFNFWWARGSHLLQMSEPGIFLSNRWYYESYIVERLPAQMIHNISSTSGESHQVGSHCLAARKALNGAQSPMLLQRTYNYNDTAPIPLFETHPRFERAYSLAHCALNSGVSVPDAIALMDRRVKIIAARSTRKADNIGQMA